MSLLVANVGRWYLSNCYLDQYAHGVIHMIVDMWIDQENKTKEERLAFQDFLY